MDLVVPALKKLTIKCAAGDKPIIVTQCIRYHNEGRPGNAMRVSEMSHVKCWNAENMATCTRHSHCLLIAHS